MWGLSAALALRARVPARERTARVFSRSVLPTSFGFRFPPGGLRFFDEHESIRHPAQMILALELISVVTRRFQVLTIATPLFFAEITTTEGAPFCDGKGGNHAL